LSTGFAQIADDLGPTRPVIHRIEIENVLHDRDSLRIERTKNQIAFSTDE